MKIRRGHSGIVFAAALLLAGVRCQFLDLNFDTPPTTKEKMLGVWEVTEATDDTGRSILKEISFPTSAFHLSDANSLNSTAGPMFMSVVYGHGKYTQIASKVDQVFQYSKLTFTEGEWFIEGGYPDRFTIEIKLQGVPGQSTITTLLNALGIAQNYLDATIYHKFKNVEVTFPDSSDSLMVWQFDYSTMAVYNTKNSEGDYVIWNGWPVTKFGRSKFVLAKRVETLQQLIKGAAASKREEL